MTRHRFYEGRPVSFLTQHGNQALMRAFHLALAKSSNSTVFAENDLRAFGNPTRQKRLLSPPRT
jgi:hypothetical protein